MHAHRKTCSDERKQLCAASINHASARPAAVSGRLVEGTGCSASSTCIVLGALRTHMLKCILSFSAVVFGRVVEGMGLLKKLDSVGSRSGKPSQRVVVADSGELPSRRQILAKLQVRDAACIRNRFSVACLRNCVTCNWNSRSVRL